MRRDLSRRRGQTRGVRADSVNGFGTVQILPWKGRKFVGNVYLQNTALSAIIYPELLSGTEMPERFGKSGSLRALV